MPEFVSIRSYRIFEDHVKNRSRYVLDTVQQQFLDTVLQTIEPTRVLPLQSGRILYRAQRGFAEGTEVERVRLFDDEGDDGGTEEIEVLVKLPKAVEKMVPTPEHAADGRVTVRGIPCLYLSTTASAAISEMRPWVGSYVTLAQFKLARDLRLVDCSLDTTESYMREPLAPGATEPNAAHRERAVWGDIGHAFSKPVTHDEPHLDYVSTQILAEAFRSKGFDGVAYRSLLDKHGTNIALFDVNATQLRLRCLYHVEYASLKSRKIESDRQPTTWPASIESEFRSNLHFLDLNEIPDDCTGCDSQSEHPLVGLVTRSPANRVQITI